MNATLLENPDQTACGSRREAELSALVDKPLGEVAKLPDEVVTLRQQVGYWKGTFEQAKRKNEKSQKEIDSLRAENRQLKDRLFAAKSEKKPSKDRSNGLDDPKAVNTPRRPRGHADNDVTEIWAAEGTYRPTKLIDSGTPRSVTFSLLDGVSLVGGSISGSIYNGFREVLTPEVPYPDLVGSMFEIVGGDDTEIWWGDTITIDFAVANIGAMPAGASQSTILLSLDETISLSSDIVLTSISVPALGSGDIYWGQLDSRIRSAVYYRGTEMRNNTLIPQSLFALFSLTYAPMGDAR